MVVQHKIENIFERIYIYLLAFVSANGAVIRYFDYRGMNAVANFLGSTMLSLLVIITLFLVITRKNTLVHAFKCIIAFLLLYIYQKIIVSAPDLNLYWGTFFITGVSGFLCGIALKKPIKFICITGTISLICGVFLIPEPLTRSLLGYTSMNLGYTLAPLVIWLMLFYYYSHKCKKLILSVAIVLGVMTILFTSRGCGLSIIVAFILIYFIDKYRRGQQISTRIVGVSILGCIAYLGITQVAVNIVNKSGVSLLTGSLLNKMITGVAADDNGRTIIFEQAWKLFKQHAILGVGMGTDRSVLNYVFPHNIMLEVLLHFGVLVGLCLIIAYWVIVGKSIKQLLKTQYAIIIPVLCAKTWLRLLFSDSYLSNMFSLMFILGLSIRFLMDVKGKKMNESFKD